MELNQNNGLAQYVCSAVHVCSMLMSWHMCILSVSCSTFPCSIPMQCTIFHSGLFGWSIHGRVHYSHSRVWHIWTHMKSLYEVICTQRHSWPHETWVYTYLHMTASNLRQCQTSHQAGKILGKFKSHVLSRGLECEGQLDTWHMRWDGVKPT